MNHTSGKYAIFFDIDGTLSEEKTGIVPESTKMALSKAKENGHFLFINSGRCKAIIPDDLMQLGFDGCIGGCGTYIEFKGKELFHRVLEDDLAEMIRNDLIQYNIDGVLEGKEFSYFSNHIFHPKVKQVFKFGTVHKLDAVRYWDDEKMMIDKMALWFDETSDIEAFKKKYIESFSFIRRDDDFYEVVPKGYSKAQGIEKIVELLGMEKENTIAIGDSTNDIEMLEYAQISIAMGNGNPCLFDKVTYVTDPVNEGGIYNALKHFGII